MKIIKSKECRICGNDTFSTVIDFGENPLVNSLLTEVEIGTEETYPLKVKQCKKCFFVQIKDIVDAREIYQEVDYLYFSSDMPNLDKYFTEFAEEVRKRFLPPEEDSLVVEIGSNDGIWLSNFKESCRILGVDPAINVVVRALSKGIPTLPAFFTERIATLIDKEYGKAKVIMGANCIAHTSDLHDLMRGVETLLDDEGVFIVECNYWGAMVKNKNYALIYHDHYSYFTLKDWVTVAEMHGLRVFDAEVTPAQGGSLRVFMSKVPHTVSERMTKLALEEKNLGTLKTAKKYCRDVNHEAQKLAVLIKGLKSEGKTIMGYGAAAKGFSVLTLAGITNEIDFFVDDSPAKQGKFTPVTHIPIRRRETVPDPDYFLITAPNYKNAIIAKEKAFIASGGKFITVDSEIIG